MKPKPIIEQIKRIESKQTTKLDDLKIADYACRLVIEMEDEPYFDDDDAVTDAVKE
nr:hypothetical protein [uncultured Flavobacterium sp.]